MSHEDDPVEDVLAQLRERDARFQLWLEHLRAGDPAFAEASALQSWDSTEWQSAVYLLTGCDVVWRSLGARVLGDRSIAPVIREDQDPSRGWSHSERDVMAWAAHFWNVDANDVTGFPWVFEQFLFQRWITACHLRRKMPPALAITDAPIP